MKPQARHLSLLAVGLVAGLASGCAPRGCDNPYVLDFVDQQDRKADIAHVGLLRDRIGSTPVADPRARSCAIWRQVQNPAYRTDPRQPRFLLRPQYFVVTQLEDGWRVDPDMP